MKDSNTIVLFNKDKRVTCDREFGCEYSPSEFISVESVNVTTIRMTCGGGLGGSSWNEYVTKVSDCDDGFIMVTTYDGEKKMLNKNYIVCMDEISKLIIVTENRYKWSHYRGRIPEGDDAKDICKSVYIADRYIKVLNEEG